MPRTKENGTKRKGAAAAGDASAVDEKSKVSKTAKKPSKASMAAAAAAAASDVPINPVEQPPKKRAKKTAKVAATEVVAEPAAVSALGLPGELHSDKAVEAAAAAVKVAEAAAEEAAANVADLEKMISSSLSEAAPAALPAAAAAPLAEVVADAKTELVYNPITSIVPEFDHAKVDDEEYMAAKMLEFRVFEKAFERWRRSTNKKRPSGSMNKDDEKKLQKALHEDDKKEPKPIISIGDIKKMTAAWGIHFSLSARQAFAQAGQAFLEETFAHAGRLRHAASAKKMTLIQFAEAAVAVAPTGTDLKMLLHVPLFGSESRAEPRADDDPAKAMSRKVFKAAIDRERAKDARKSKPPVKRSTSDKDAGYTHPSDKFVMVCLERAEFLQTRARDEYINGSPTLGSLWRTRSVSEADGGDVDYTMTDADAATAAAQADK